MLISEVRLYLKKTMVATFDETRALTSRKSVIIQDMNIAKSTQKYKFFRSHSSLSVLE